MNGEQKIGTHNSALKSAAAVVVDKPRLNSALKSAAAVVVDKPRLALALKTLKEKVLEWFACLAEGNLTVVNKQNCFGCLRRSNHRSIPGCLILVSTVNIMQWVIITFLLLHCHQQFSEFNLHF